jgi:hypothetical protein
MALTYYRSNIAGTAAHYSCASLEGFLASLMNLLAFGVALLRTRIDGKGLVSVFRQMGSESVVGPRQLLAGVFVEARVQVVASAKSLGCPGLDVLLNEIFPG